MKKSALIFSALFALAMLANGCSKRQPVVATTTATPKMATEEIHRTFQMRPNSSVTVDFFDGPVDVQTTDSDTAEVHITRTSRYESDLKDEPINRLEYEEYNGTFENLETIQKQT
jgi:PBP1b-binding outer membrane lipoprotein LpoB